MTTLITRERPQTGFLPDRVLDEALASSGRLPVGTVAVTPHHWDHQRLAAGVRILAEDAAERGRAYEEVLAGTGLSPEGLDEPGASVEASQEIAATRNLLRMFDTEPGLGLEIGRRFHLTTFGMYGLMMMSTPLMVDVARTGLRLNGLTCTFSTVTAEITSDGLFTFGFRVPSVPADVRRFLMERELAAFATAHAELFAGDADVPLLSARSEFTGTVADPLLGIPIEFGSCETALVFEPFFLARELPQASPNSSLTGRSRPPRSRRRGFSDLPSFLRAQRRWGATTPSVRRSA